MHAQQGSLLTAEEEIALADRVHGSDELDGLEARNELVRRNMGLVGDMVKKQGCRGDWDELVAEGTLGLLTAAERYDPRAHDGTRFSTFARWWILNGIQRALKSLRRQRSMWTDDGHPIVDPAGEGYDWIASQAAWDTGRELAAAIDRLTSREKQVIKGRYWLKLPLRTLALDLGVTVERVRQIQDKAVAKLRERMAG